MYVLKCWLYGITHPHYVHQLENTRNRQAARIKALEGTLFYAQQMRSDKDVWKLRAQRAERDLRIAYANVDQFKQGLDRAKASLEEQR